LTVWGVEQKNWERGFGKKRHAQYWKERFTDDAARRIPRGPEEELLRRDLISNKILKVKKKRPRERERPVEGKERRRVAREGARHTGHLLGTTG